MFTTRFIADLHEQLHEKVNDINLKVNTSNFAGSLVLEAFVMRDI